jgi:hypothetical protein
MAPVTRNTYLNNPLMLRATSEAVTLDRDSNANKPVGDRLPGKVKTWLARLRLLEGVPFAHLVPDAELLPLESIRFFYLDREWTDALVQGALSVSTVTTLDRQHLQALHLQIREEIDAEERRVRLVGGDDPAPAAAETISGFLLRSRAVSGWPALHVRAYDREIGRDDADAPQAYPPRVRVLRLERLAPAVLLCLFDGVPRLVHIEEPRQGIQFGIDFTPGEIGVATIPLRDVLTATRLDDVEPPPAGITAARVPFRRNAPGVIHVRELANRIANQQATNVDAFEAAGVQSAEFAMQMLQFPYRQVFGDPAQSTRPGARTLTYDDVFHPTVSMAQLRRWEAGERE